MQFIYHTTLENFKRENKEIIEFSDRVWKSLPIPENLKSYTFKENGMLDKALDHNPIEFWGYYADYDWVVFCSIFGKMIDLPKGFSMYCNDLKQVMFDLNLDDDFILKEILQNNQHNALEDAKWNKKLYDYLINKGGVL